MIRAVLSATLLVVTPCSGFAQTPSAPSSDRSFEKRVPAATVSFGIGLFLPWDTLTLVPRSATSADPLTMTLVPLYTEMPRGVVSVQLPIGPSALIDSEISWQQAAGEEQFSRVEGDFIRHNGLFVQPSISHYAVAESRQILTAGASLVVRDAGDVLSPFFGVGLGVERTSGTIDVRTSCTLRVPGGCDGQLDTMIQERDVNVAPQLRLSVGLDARVSSRFVAFVETRWMTTHGLTSSNSYGDAAYSMIGGTRVALRTRRAPLSSANGTRRVLRAGMMGLAAGAFLGVIPATMFHEDGRIVAPAMFMGIGFGAGLAIGAIN